MFLIQSAIKKYPIASLDSFLGLQDVEASKISGQSAHDVVKVISPRLRPLLLYRKYARS
jgi:hypothetical protein